MVEPAFDSFTWIQNPYTFHLLMLLSMEYKSVKCSLKNQTLWALGCTYLYRCSQGIVQRTCVTLEKFTYMQVYSFIPFTMTASLAIFKDKNNARCFKQSLEKQPAPTVHSVDLLWEWQVLSSQTKQLRVSTVPNAAMTFLKDLACTLENKYHN